MGYLRNLVLISLQSQGFPRKKAKFHSGRVWSRARQQIVAESVRTLLVLAAGKNEKPTNLRQMPKFYFEP